MHLATDEDLLVTFQINWKNPWPVTRQCKWMLTTGELLEEKQFSLSLADRFDISPDQREIAAFKDFSSSFSHRTVRRHVLSRRGDKDDLLVMYDYAVDELSARWIECACLYREPHKFYSPAILAPNIVYYYALDINQPAVYDVVSSTTTLLPDKLDERVAAGRTWLEGHLQSFGDQEVFGLSSDGGIELWFFNPKFLPDIPGEEPLVIGSW